MLFVLSRAAVVPGKLLRIPAALSPPARRVASAEPPERTLDDGLATASWANVSDTVLDAVLPVSVRVAVLSFLVVVRVFSRPARDSVGLVSRSLVAQRTVGTFVRVGASFAGALE